MTAPSGAEVHSREAVRLFLRAVRYVLGAGRAVVEPAHFKCPRCSRYYVVHLEGWHPARARPWWACCEPTFLERRQVAALARAWDWSEAERVALMPGSALAPLIASDRLRAAVNEALDLAPAGRRRALLKVRRRLSRWRF